MEQEIIESDFPYDFWGKEYEEEEDIKCPECGCNIHLEWKNKSKVAKQENDDGN